MKVAVKYSVMLNGVTEIALTMLDVLAGFDEIFVCTKYRVGSSSVGATTDRFLPDATELENAEPVYERLAGFDGDLSVIKHREQLPIEALRFIEMIEKFVDVPVTIASVGPARSETITA